MLKLQADIQLIYSLVNNVDINIMQTYNKFHLTEQKYTGQLLDMRGEVNKLAKQFFKIANEFNKTHDPKKWEDI